jgi:hypothetical protein
VSTEDATRNSRWRAKSRAADAVTVGIRTEVAGRKGAHRVSRRGGRSGRGVAGRLSVYQLARALMQLVLAVTVVSILRQFRRRRRAVG